jgi:hypothetical protein
MFIHYAAIVYLLLNNKSVGHIDIIDLASKTTLEMLEQQLDPNIYSKIKLASTITPYTLSEYGIEIINAFAGTSPSRTALRKTLIETGLRLNMTI